MFNDVANTAASQLIGHPPKSNLEPREITNDRLDRQDRRVEDILTLSPKAVKALEQNIATFNLKNESYAEARAEVLSTRELTDKEFFSLDVKLQEPIITSINKKFTPFIIFVVQTLIVFACISALQRNGPKLAIYNHGNNKRSEFICLMNSLLLLFPWL